MAGIIPIVQGMVKQVIAGSRQGFSVVSVCSRVNPHSDVTVRVFGGTIFLHMGQSNTRRYINQSNIL